MADSKTLYSDKGESILGLLFSPSINLIGNGNLFYDRNVVFTDGLANSRYLYFQLIGNLGGWASEGFLEKGIDYFIIADRVVSSENDEFDELKNRIVKLLKSGGKGFKQTNILRESDFIGLVRGLGSTRQCKSYHNLLSQLG